MHSFNEATAGVPAFLAKLWRLVEDPDTNDLICWRSDGKSFLIQNQAQFARELLPLNYKHNNMASFIRQLNMYGFHKITSIDNGGLKFDKDEMEFSHPYFQKDQPYLLEHIKRKIANQKPSTEEKGSMKPETINKVMNEVKSMRGRQDTLDSRFSAMKQENEALWREIAVLRQKHLKQQQIVNKLIQFLVTIVQPTRGNSSINNMNGVKRRFQLMINNVPEEQASKIRKLDNEESGPVIHELTEDLFDDVNYDEDLQNSPNVLSPELHSTHTNDSLDDISSPVTFKIEKPEVQYENILDDENNIVAEEIDDDNVSFIINELEPDGSWIEQDVINAKTIPTSANQSRNPSSSQGMVISSIQSAVNNQIRSTRSSRTNSESILNVNQNKKVNRKDPALRLKINDTKSIKMNGKSLTTVPSNKEAAEKSSIQKSADDYTRADFLSTEIPNELLQSADETASVLNELSTASGSFNPTLSEDYTKKIKQPTSSKNMALTKYSNNKYKDSTVRINSADDVNAHIDSLQTDLDSLKDFFQNDDYSLDPNTLMGNSTGATTSKNRFLLSPSVDSELFSKIFGDLDAPYELSLNPDFAMEKRNDAPSTSGSELITYQPYSNSNIDLSEFLMPPSPITNTQTNDDEDITNEDLNTPCIDKGKISFKTK